VYVGPNKKVGLFFSAVDRQPRGGGANLPRRAAAAKLSFAAS
jgi:hypothetical protein